MRTDHSALTWLLSFRNLEGQTARCIKRLQEYGFTSEHRQSIRHTNADHFPGAHAPRGFPTAIRCSNGQPSKRYGQLSLHLLMAGTNRPWGWSSWQTTNLGH